MKNNLNRITDVNSKVFGGDWKARLMKKKKPQEHPEHGKPVRLYKAYPPETGWPGGDPRLNGYKPGGGKK